MRSPLPRPWAPHLLRLHELHAREDVALRLRVADVRGQELLDAVPFACAPSGSIGNSRSDAARVNAHVRATVAFGPGCFEMFRVLDC